MIGIKFIDFTTIVYILTVVLSGYGFGLFLWWWRKIGKATEVYKYVTLLFFGLLMSSSTGVYSRWVRAACCFEDYQIFTNSIWRAVGPIIVLSVLLAIASRMTRRVWLFHNGSEELIMKELKLMVCPTCGHYCSLGDKKNEEQKGE